MYKQEVEYHEQKMGLFERLFNDTCPKCGAKVSKKARFCSACGHGAPEGWFKCPACGKWVGNDSRYCPHCNHPMHPEDRISLAGGVWDRDLGLFAQRFELGDVRFIRENGLLIQEGTVAILMDGGEETKVLGPGRHKPDGLLRDINWFGNPPPRSAVLVDAGDCIFRIDFTGLNSGGLASAEVRSAEDLKVTAVAEITLRFDRSRAEDFLSNFIKDRSRIGVKEVIGDLYEEALSAVRDLCQQSTIEDLVKDPDRRSRFEEAIARALKEPLKRRGLELVRVGAVEFVGAAYEELRAKYGELEKARRLVEFEKKQLELLADEEKMRSVDSSDRAEREAQEKMTSAERVKRVEDYLAQLAQEKEIGEIARTQELQIAVRVAKGEVSRTEAEQEMARLAEAHAKELQTLANKLELDLTLRNYDREQLVKDAENKAKLSAIDREEKLRDAKLGTVLVGEQLTQAKTTDEIERIRIARELWEAKGWVEVKRQKDEAKIAELKGRADVLDGKSELTLAALADDPAARQAFLDQEIAKLKMKTDATLTPEQLLARDAGKSASAAEALARLAEAREGAARQVLDELKRADAERHQHDDKILDKIAEIAKTAVEHQSTTVVPPTPVTNMQH